MISRITYFDGLLITLFDGLPDSASLHSVDIAGSGTGKIVPDTLNCAAVLTAVKDASRR
jgi:hypothetical protein